MIRFFGIDIGTSRVKAALFNDEGQLLSGAEEMMPGVRLRRSEGGVLSATQDPAELRRTVDRAVASVLGSPLGIDLVALTVQRDTFVLVDRREAPVTPIVSWLDGRREGGAVPLDALLQGVDDPSLVCARSVASWISARWTGRAVETPATRPRFMTGASKDRIEERLGRSALPFDSPVGAEVGPIEPIGTMDRPSGGRTGDEEGETARSAAELLDAAPLHLTAGDKNCEYLGARVVTPGVAGLSLGSAITLGVLAPEVERPGWESPSGVVVTPAAVPGRMNLETGVVFGHVALDLLSDELEARGQARIATETGFGTRGGIDEEYPPFLVPWYGGALDGAGEGIRVAGAEGADEATMRVAWMWGIVAELRRLRPLLEEAAGTRLREVRILGGGGRNRGWATLVASAFALPVLGSADRFSGVRGAIASALHGRRSPVLSEAYRREMVGRLVRSDRGADFIPQPTDVQRFDRWYEQWLELARS